jgi:hypothetical protein
MSARIDRTEASSCDEASGVGGVGCFAARPELARAWVTRLRRLPRLALRTEAIHRVALRYGTIFHVSRAIRDPID